MRLYSFAVKNQIRLGAELAGRIFPLSRLLEWFSVGITLTPGDVVTTGTPAGIGCFRNPQVFLKPGDVCELEISGFGKLVNRVVADEYRFPQRFSQRKPNFTEDFVGKP